MTELTYEDSPVAVREGLANAHRYAWRRLAAPGTWWSGPTRVAVAAEVRNAAACGLCRRRKEALSPYTLGGVHDSLGSLPESHVDVIHRIVTDPGRLSRTWLDDVLASCLSDAEYVETVGVIVNVMAIDQFRRGIGMAPAPLPESLPGEPMRVRPRGAKPGADKRGGGAPGGRAIRATRLPASPEPRRPRRRARHRHRRSPAAARSRDGRP